MALLRAHVPKWPTEPDLLEYGFHRVDRLSPPVVPEPVNIPQFRQLPTLIGRDDLTARDLAVCAPAIDMLFRPEEEDRRSGESDILPESPGRDREVNHPGARDRRPAPDPQGEHLPAIGAARHTLGVNSE